MPGDSVFQFFVDGVLIDTITASPVSWSAATILLGEGQGANASQPASTWWFDEATFVASGVEQLGNRGFESALAGTYTTPNVYGNWCNAKPDRGSNRYNDLAYAGSWSGGIKKPVGIGGWLHQDMTTSSLDNSEFRVMVRRSSTTPNGAAEASVLLDWDRGGGSVAGVVSMSQTNSGTISCHTLGTTHTGFDPIADDEWVEWKIRIYPAGLPAASLHIGSLRFGSTGLGW